MSTPIPTTPVELLAMLELMQVGDDKHQGSAPLSKGLRKELDDARSALSARSKAVVATRATYREAVQSRDEFLSEAEDVARKVRDAIYSLHGKSNQQVGDYGLSTPVRRHGSTETQAKDTPQPPKE